MYRAPVREMRFVLEELLGAGSLAASAELADYSDELARSVLEEAARFAEGVLEPLNRPGDLHGARWTPDGVVTAPGFRDAYRQFAAGGWTALGADPNFGGHPAPRALVTAAGGFWGSACLAHKLGIHASPTCVLAFGEKQGALADLVGEPGRGLEYMFIMMNSARLSVGSEGYAVGERALQRATEWARTRLQGKAPLAAGAGPVPIIQHPDVKRMLLTMKSQTEASRALTLYAAFQFDLAAHSADGKVRRTAQARGELLTPVVKGWCTEIGNEVAATGVQVHGGMGYIEETGAAQYVRDVRITTIYEGTTGIQGNDLIGRKLGRDRGAAIGELIAEMERELRSLESGDPAVLAVREAALGAVAALKSATQALLRTLASRPEVGLAVSVPYLKLCGYVIGGWLLAKSAAIAAAKVDGPESAFYAAKIRTAAFYAAQVLPTTAALARVVEGGGASVAETDAALI